MRPGFSWTEYIPKSWTFSSSADWELSRLPQELKKQKLRLIIMLFWMFISSLLAAGIGLGIYVYYLRKGQFEDPEAVKYQIFREDDPDS